MSVNVQEEQQNTEKPVSSYVPDLSLENPTELRKVTILEETVQKGSLKDLTDVLETYKSFEMTARALGLAARYRGVEYVKVLMEHGATFQYKDYSALKAKYGMIQKTMGGSYWTQYYLMVIPQKLNLSSKRNSMLMIIPKTNSKDRYEYSALYGVKSMNIMPDLKPLSIEERIEVAKFFMANSELKVSMDEMLFWALTRGEIKFADALIGMGVTLRDTPPMYYHPQYTGYPYENTNTSTYPVYMTIITDLVKSVYWDDYVESVSSLKKAQVLPVLKRLSGLAEKAGRKIVCSQNMFDKVRWDEKSLAYALENIDLSRVNKLKAMESAVTGNDMAALKKMVEAGWMKNAQKREALISFAQENKAYEILAWLMDYKNRTVDIAAEEAKKTARMLRALTEKPDSVSAMKKIWSYRKLEDGSLEITNYKGDSTEVEIPAMIGKNVVTAIGEGAFSGMGGGRRANAENHKKITSVIVPEGVTVIGQDAFANCKSMRMINLPTTLETIGESAFLYCENLNTVVIPNNIKSIAPSAFIGCKSLEDENGFIIINGMLLGYYGKESSIRIPERVKVIVSLGKPREISEVILPILPDEAIEIRKDAFEGVRLLDVTRINIPESVCRIECSST